MAAVQYAAKLTNERWPSSFGQLLLFFKWNLCLLLGCLFKRMLQVQCINVAH